ncbi:pentapeptide repeat-containing protein [Micromonospora zamorensis]|uniref:pentapeptide repeat-containing protein n=1 Tax=Micromonospora zamorensis TaxID=709883 RepID=UPI003CEF1918
MPTDWWLKALRGLSDLWLTIAISALGTAVLAFGIRLRRRARPGTLPSAAPLPPDRQLRPIQPWVLPAGALVVLAVTCTAILWLQWAVPQDVNSQKAKLRIDAIRTGLSVGAGTAGALALLLALRRQQLAERSQQATEYDAGEKRVTELYVKAAEQLGSEKAPVRLAGLYALERLAQDNPAHRQSITEVICAYLRMPLPPAPTATGPDDAVEYAQQTEKWSGERQVRLAAQKLLVRHAKRHMQGSSQGMFWGNLSLDLAEATLINADFSETDIGTLNCRGSRFVGYASFRGATFHSRPDFDGAVFDAEASFAAAQFALGADFIRSRFKNTVRFSKSRFDGEADFSLSVFEGAALFDNSSFTGDADLSHCTFRGNLRFLNTKFGKDAWFDGSMFYDRLGFDRSTFGGDASFESARFEGSVFFRILKIEGHFDFSAATISKREGTRPNVWPEEWKESTTGESLEREEDQG